MNSEHTLYILLELIPYALGTAHFACTIVLLIRWAILRSARSRGRILRPDMHKYASVRYPKSFKVLAVIVIGGYLLVIIPAIVYGFCMGFERDPLILVAVAFVLGLCGTVGIAMSPMCHKEVSATVDSRGLTIEYQDGEKKTISVHGYKGYICETKKQAFRLSYEGDDGKDEYVYLPFLSANDAIAVGKDLNTLRDHGYIEPPKDNSNQAAPVKSVSIPVRTPEETQKINEKLAYTNPINAGAKIDDQAKYRDYLEDVLKKISVEKREQIIKLVQQGKKAEAMRECQRASGEGLRIASDLFGNYLMFPDLKYFTCRIYAQIVDSEYMRKSFKEYNEIYTDPDKSCITSEGDLGNNWHYIELSANPVCPDEFTFAEYMNILIWMSELTYSVFAYAKPNNTFPGNGNNAIDRVGAWANNLPFYAEPDKNDQLTESCLGIMNDKEFRFVVTELGVSYKNEVAPGFDIESYIYQHQKVKV